MKFTGFNARRRAYTTFTARGCEELHTHRLCTGLDSWRLAIKPANATEREHHESGSG
jgi:hypothetical protein